MAAANDDVWLLCALRGAAGSCTSAVDAIVKLGKTYARNRCAHFKIIIIIVIFARFSLALPYTLRAMLAHLFVFLLLSSCTIYLIK